MEHSFPFRNKYAGQKSLTSAFVAQQRLHVDHLHPQQIIRRYRAFSARNALFCPFGPLKMTDVCQSGS